MAAMRLLRTTRWVDVYLLSSEIIADLVLWLNREDPERAGFDRGLFTDILGARHPRKTLEYLRDCSYDDYRIEGGPLPVFLPWYLTQKPERLNANPAKRMRQHRLLTLGVMPSIFVSLREQKKSLRRCACKCGKWFLAERKNQRFCGDHRKRAWQRDITPERKERRRIQNREAQRRFYDRTFKSDPSA